MDAALYTNRLAYSDVVGMKFDSMDSQVIEVLFV